MENLMNDNLFNKLAYRVAAKAPDVTPEEIRIFDEEVIKRQRMADDEREMLFQQRQMRIQRGNEARPAPSSPAPADAPDDKAPWVPLIQSVEWTILSRSRGSIQHHDFGFTRPGSSEPQQLFVAGNAFVNFMTMATNLNHRMKR